MDMNTAERIKQKAIELGAKDADWRKWKFRKRIPAEWRERIFVSSSGAITFHNMDTIFREK
jgi:hypothetical protein